MCIAQVTTIIITQPRKQYTTSPGSRPHEPPLHPPASMHTRICIQVVATRNPLRRDGKSRQHSTTTTAGCKAPNGDNLQRFWPGLAFHPIEACHFLYQVLFSTSLEPVPPVRCWTSHFEQTQHTDPSQLRTCRLPKAVSKTSVFPHPSIERLQRPQHAGNVIQTSSSFPI